MALIEGKVLMMLTVGFSHFVDIGKSEDAVIYYKSATEVQMLLPGAALMVGTWSIQSDGYFVKWNDGPEGKWQITHAEGEMTYIDPSGKPAGKVTKIVPGNAGRF